MMHGVSGEHTTYSKLPRALRNTERLLCARLVAVSMLQPSLLLANFSLRNLLRSSTVTPTDTGAVAHQKVVDGLSFSLRDQMTTKIHSRLGTYQAWKGLS